MKSTRIKSFTLAEVLVVLVIIGVVAAISIPTLIQSTQHQEFLAGLKKFYSQANGALEQVAVSNGTPGDIKGFSDNDALAHAIMDNFKIVKFCENSDTTTQCMIPTNSSYDISGGTLDFNAWWYYRFITADGMTVAMAIRNNACDTHYTSDTNSPTYNYCGDIVVDVNGSKPPNVCGRDVFGFDITSNKAPLLYSWGGKDDFDPDAGQPDYWNGPNPSCQNSNTTGWTCAARIMEEGWQMNY